MTFLTPQHRAVAAIVSVVAVSIVSFSTLYETSLSATLQFQTNGCGEPGTAGMKSDRKTNVEIKSFHLTTHGNIRSHTTKTGGLCTKDKISDCDHHVTHVYAKDKSEDLRAYLFLNFFDSIYGDVIAGNEAPIAAGKGAYYSAQAESPFMCQGLYRAFISIPPTTTAATTAPVGRRRRDEGVNATQDLSDEGVDATQDLPDPVVALSQPAWQVTNSFGLDGNNDAICEQTCEYLYNTMYASLNKQLPTGRDGKFVASIPIVMPVMGFVLLMVLLLFVIGAVEGFDGRVTMGLRGGLVLLLLVIMSLSIAHVVILSHYVKEMHGGDAGRELWLITTTLLALVSAGLVLTTEQSSYQLIKSDLMANFM